MRVRVLKYHVYGTLHCHPGDVYEMEDRFVQVMVAMLNVEKAEDAKPPTPTPPLPPVREPDFVKHPDKEKDKEKEQPHKHRDMQPEEAPKPYRRRDIKS